MAKKKPSEPKVIADSELDAASGGLLPAVKPTSLTIETTPGQTTSSEENNTVLSGQECLVFFVGGRT